MIKLDDFWRELGLEDNPYDSRPLTLSENDRKLFVGRDKELSQLKTLVSGKRGGIVMVEGGIGVGKTSFVNILQHDKWKNDKFLPSFEKIELEENIEPTQFMLSVFSNMVYNLEKASGPNITRQHEILKEAKMLIAKTLEAGWGGQASIFGTGGGISKQKTASQPLAVVLPTILNIMNGWISYVTSKTIYSAILVPINNLDILQDKDVIEFLNRMRDTLIDRPSVWWILIGKIGLFSTLEGEAHRVSEIITGRPIILKPLTLAQVHNAIKIRLDSLRISKRVDPIVPGEIVDILYDVSKGEIRYIFKRITDIIYLFKPRFPSEKQIPLNAAEDLLMELAKQRLEDAQLTEREMEVLKMMVSKEKFRNKDYKDFGLKTAQALNYYLDKLTKLGLTTREESLGKAIFYRTTGDVNLLFKKKGKKR